MSLNAHTFNVSLAAEMGLNQAILLQHLYYWHQINDKKKHNIKDGKVWTYNTIKGFNEIFPYLTAKQITYAFNKLEKEGYLETGNYNKAAFDRTKWYSLTEQSLTLFTDCNLQNVKSNLHIVKSDLHIVKSDLHIVNTIPDNNPDNNTNNNNKLDVDKGKVFFKIVELYPQNRIGNRQHGLKKFKDLEVEDCKLALKNLHRYLDLAGGYVKTLQNYLDEGCYTETWLEAETKNKNQKQSIKVNTKTFTADYDNVS